MMCRGLLRAGAARNVKEGAHGYPSGNGRPEEGWPGPAACRLLPCVYNAKEKVVFQEKFNEWRVPVERYVEKGYWRKLSLYEELAGWAEQHAERVAVTDSSGSVCYRELKRLVDRQASALYRLGIRQGDRLLVQLPNRKAFVILLFALFRIGAVPVLTMPASREHEILALCSHSEPVAYVAASSYLGFGYEGIRNRLAAELPGIRFFLSDDGRMPGTMGLDALYSDEPLDCPLPDFQETALLLISGGTTGIPKLIPRRHCDYAYVSRTCAGRCGMDASSVYMAVLPVAHNFPLCCPGLLGIMSRGGRLVMCETPSPEEAFALIEREGVTHTALVPSLVSLWLEAREWEETDLSSLRLLQVGGAYFDPAVAARVQPELGCALQQVFGTAEGLICTTSAGDSLTTLLNTQGTPICPDDELRFVDPEGSDVPAGEAGELIVRGPYTIGGYYNAPEANASAITRDGYYRTGDIARMTRDGRVQLCGRIKELINRNGEKISVAEIENLLRTHPGIVDAAVIGVPDVLVGERICAWIIPEEEVEPDLAAVHAFLGESGLARYKFPDQLETIDAWPLTSVGKIDRKKLLSMVLEQEQDS